MMGDYPAGPMMGEYQDYPYYPEASMMGESQEYQIRPHNTATSVLLNPYLYAQAVNQLSKISYANFISKLKSFT